MGKAFINSRILAAAVFGTAVFAAFVALSYTKLDRRDLQVYAIVYLVYLALVWGLSAIKGESSSRDKSGLLLAIIAFFAGPVLALVFWACSVFLFSGDYYLTWAERTEFLPHMLALGLFVGAVIAVGLAIFKSD